MPIHRDRVEFILMNWLTELWGLASLQSLEQTGKLEIQVRVPVAVLSLKSTGQANRLETQAGFLCYRLKGDCFLFWKP